MKSFKRYLKEETDPLESAYLFFRNFMRENFAPNYPVAATMFQNQTMRPPGGSGYFNYGVGYPMFPMANAPQPFLDMFDYNGDGIIGYNDMSLATRMFDIFEEAFGIFNFPIDELPSASWYRENWESFGQEYGLDLPDPSSWFFTIDEQGDLFFSPDAQLPLHNAERKYGQTYSNDGGNGLYEWQGTVRDYFNILVTMRGWRSVEAGGSYNVVLPPVEIMQAFFPEFYNWLMQMDFFDNGLAAYGEGTGIATAGKAAKIMYYLLELLVYHYELKLGISSSEAFDTLMNKQFEEVPQMQGFDGLNQFIQTLFLTGDKLSIFGLPDGYDQYAIYFLMNTYGYGFDPNYGQVPTPPEETPIAQSPYQITQLPPPENP